MKINSMKDAVNVTKCPYCGESDFVVGWQGHNSGLVKGECDFETSPVMHVVCKNCHSIVQSVVQYVGHLDDKIVPFGGNTED